MSFRLSLRQRWEVSDSFLCVGLDPDPRRIPPHLGSGPAAIGQFCREIVAATADQACAFKPQIAYFAAAGAEAALEDLIAYIHREHPGIPVNAIGLGNYFDTEMSTFLRTVANLTGGAFRGE